MVDNRITLRKTVRDILEDKHPDPKPVHPEALLEDLDDSFHPAIFDNITAESIGLLLFTLKVLLDPLHLMLSAGDDYALPSGKSSTICVQF